MFRIKQILKNDRARILLIAVLLSLLCLAIRRVPGAARNLSDFCFVVGIVHIFVGATRYIHNVGLFKTFSYTAYKRRWRKHGHPTGETRPMSLAEYTQNVVMDESRQRPVAWSLITGVLWCAVSLLPAMLAVYRTGA